MLSPVNLGNGGVTNPLTLITIADIFRCSLHYGFLARLRSLSAAPFSCPRGSVFTTCLDLSFQSFLVKPFFKKPLILSSKTGSLKIPENLLSRSPPYLPCLSLGESSLAVVPLSDIVSFPALIWVFMTCSISSVLKLGVVTYVCLGPISAVALTGLHAVIVAWGAYFSPLLSLARSLHLRLYLWNPSLVASQK